MKLQSEQGGRCPNNRIYFITNTQKTLKLSAFRKNINGKHALNVVKMHVIYVKITFCIGLMSGVVYATQSSHGVERSTYGRGGCA